jgi:hypothetical protein
MRKVVSEISGAVFSLPWLIAKDQGLFEAEGIDMEFVRTRPSGAISTISSTIRVTQRCLPSMAA